MKIETHVHHVVVMGIKINFYSILYLDASDMTQFSAAQRKQAIGRLQVRQRVLVVAKIYNVHVNAINRFHQ